MEWAVAVALAVATVSLIWAWSLHRRVRELEEADEDRSFDEQRRGSLLFD